MRALIPYFLTAALLFCNSRAVAETDFDKGVRSYQAHDYRAALADFSATLKATPSPEAMYYAALCYQQLGDTAHATEYFLLVTKLFPDSSAATLAKQGMDQIDSAQKLPASRPGKASPPGAPSAHASIVGMPGEAPGAADDLANLPDEVRVPFQRSAGNVLYVDGAVNGRRFRMMFDTGAAVCLFPRNQLATIGVGMNEKGPKTQVGGIGGTATVQQAVLDVSVGSITRKTVVEITDYRSEPLIGPSYFQGYTYSIDNAGGFLHFMKTGSSSGSDSAYQPTDVIKIPFIMQNRHMIVQAKVNGIPCQMIFDTGAGICFFPSGTAQALGIGMTDDSKLVGLQGAVGKSTGISTFVNRIELGPILRTHVAAVIGGAPFMLLGQSFFGGRQFTIDNENHTINFVH